MAASAFGLLARNRPVLDGHGNFGLDRTDGSTLRWLQVSKYPPSLAFLALELGIMALGLAFLFRLQELRGARATSTSFLAVLGRSALFFYLVHLHVPVLFGSAVGGGWWRPPAWGLAGAWGGGIAVSLALVPACRWFEAYKRRHPTGVARWF